MSPSCPTPAKRVYADRKAARLALRRYRGHGLGKAPSLRAYLCVCGRFHLGNLPPPVVRGEFGRDRIRSTGDAA